MKIEEFLDGAVDAEDLQNATDAVCNRLACIEDMLESQVAATRDLTSAIYNLATSVEMK